MLVKTIAMISIVDDTYDVYGTTDELATYTDVIQSYKALLDLYEDYEKEMSSDGRSHVVYDAKEKMKELVKSYNIEAKWFIEGHMPPASECLRNAVVTTTYYFLATTSYLGMTYAKEKEFEWLSKNMKILEGKVVPNSKAVRKLLSVLPESWECKVEAISEAHNLDTLTMDELIRNLKTVLTKMENSSDEFEDEEPQNRSLLAMVEYDDEDT
ncbi:hypothetical protein T459_04877 [Capsicum annuum]|uniref:Terpene synthase metal-binding domain-containing protein n=1 Tax=Capsicum annuum TaxID=4072 RepID=A0A2G3A6A7_CAPAN|nr:hypothetical protein T459_04877 [Capsicum annuum]